VLLVAAALGLAKAGCVTAVAEYGSVVILPDTDGGSGKADGGSDGGQDMR
jgi:hypothetical protein